MNPSPYKYPPNIETILTDEVVLAYRVILKYGATSESRFSLRDEWKVLFSVYNKYSGMPPMGMGCAPCYAKVLSWVSGAMLRYVKADDK